MFILSQYSLLLGKIVPKIMSMRSDFGADLIKHGETHTAITIAIIVKIIFFSFLFTTKLYF